MFDTLPKWDGFDRFKVYMDQIHFPNKELRELSTKVFQCWFVEMIASLVKPGNVNKHFLVLVGTEGGNKTKFLKNLITAEFRREYLYTGNFFPDNKDHRLKLGTKWAILLEDLQTMDDKEILKLLPCITQFQIIERRPYEIYDEIYLRRASFFGTINDENITLDTIKDKRFLVIPATRIA